MITVFPARASALCPDGRDGEALKFCRLVIAAWHTKWGGNSPPFVQPASLDDFGVSLTAAGLTSDDLLASRLWTGARRAAFG
jgi:hypothetical protein